MLGIADPLIMTPLADMRQQRLRYERIVARTLDLAQQIPAGAARVKGIENDIAVFEKAGHGCPIGIGGDMSIAAPDRIGHQHLQRGRRSEEHTSELQSIMRISYAVFCLKKKKTTD